MMAEILLIQQELECCTPHHARALDPLPICLLLCYHSFMRLLQYLGGHELVLILLSQSIQPLIGPANLSLPLAASPRERVHF